MYMYVYLLCRLPEEGRGDQNVALHGSVHSCVQSVFTQTPLDTRKKAHVYFLVMRF